MRAHYHGLLYSGYLDHFDPDHDDDDEEEDGEAEKENEEEKDDDADDHVDVDVDGVVDVDDNNTNDKVWDMFCCEGVKVLFRVALVLIKHALPRKVHIIANTFDIFLARFISLTSSSSPAPQVFTFQSSPPQQHNSNLGLIQQYDCN